MEPAVDHPPHNVKCLCIQPSRCSFAHANGHLARDPREQERAQDASLAMRDFVLAQRGHVPIEDMPHLSRLANLCDMLMARSSLPRRYDLQIPAANYFPAILPSSLRSVSSTASAPTQCGTDSAITNSVLSSSEAPLNESYAEVHHRTTRGTPPRSTPSHRGDPPTSHIEHLAGLGVLSDGSAPWAVRTSCMPDVLCTTVVPRLCS
ncbi:hypothetical protein DFH09DRAFT_1204340 [Mycena vulgaris]|nr:hypothetical protein DFH09DRAFT_1204340 [Mycena vulgaris]